MKPGARVYVAGHLGMVGQALVRKLTTRGYGNLLLRSRDELDLLDQAAVDRFFRRERPEYVFLAAAKVGGILANSRAPADFIADNMGIALNLIRASHEAGVTKLLNLGSSCVYPRLAPQPLKEEYLLTGPLEPTNQPYAIAKIAAISLCDSYRQQFGRNFFSVMPTNLYGPHDKFDLTTSHVVPAIIRRCHEAKLAGQRSVILWGTGRPRREFLHVDDLADACCFLMERYDGGGWLNVGTGEEFEIRELATLIAGAVGYEGSFTFDDSKPDGTPRKVLDVSRLSSLGWRPTISLRQGIGDTYRWYCEQVAGSAHAEAD
jgi:GDP-L-fucose synthase